MSDEDAANVQPFEKIDPNRGREATYRCCPLDHPPISPAVCDEFLTSARFALWTAACAGVRSSPLTGSYLLPALKSARFGRLRWRALVATESYLLQAQIG